MVVDRRRRSTGRYCANCGTKLASSMNYCPNCGAARDRSTAYTSISNTQSVTDRDVVEYRISKAIEEGWELEHDFGDHAVLVRRSFGNVRNHILVAVLTIWWTMGIGNALYAGYCYFAHADRAIVRASHVEGETEPRSPDSPLLGFLTTILFLLVAAVFSTLAVTAVDASLPFAALLFGLALVAAGMGLSVFPPITRRLDGRHSITTNGRSYTVEERVVYETETPCSSCYGSVGRGVERTYRNEFVILGVPLTSNGGTNVYCQVCANAELDRRPTGATETTNRVDTDFDVKSKADPEYEGE